MKTTLKSAAATLVLAFAITTLAASVPAAPAAIGQADKPAATATPKADEPLEGDYDGDGKIGPWDLEQAAKATYTMPDGTKVAIPRDKPLPAEVVADVQAVVAAKAGPSASSQAALARDHAAVLAVEDASSKLDRSIVALYYGFDGGQQRMAWASLQIRRA